MMPMIPSHQTPGPVPVKASEPEVADVAELVVAVAPAVVAEEEAVVAVVGGDLAPLAVLKEIGTGTWSPARSPTRWRKMLRRSRLGTKFRSSRSCSSSCCCF